MSNTPTAADYSQERAAVQTALEAFFTKPGQEPARAMNTERGYWEMTRGGAAFARIACEFKGGRLVIMTHAYRRVLATVDLPA